MTENRFRKITGALFSFSRRESRRVLLLLPLLVVLCLLFVRVDRPRFEQSYTRYSDRVLDSMQSVRTSYNKMGQINIFRKTMPQMKKEGRI